MGITLDQLLALGQAPAVVLLVALVAIIGITGYRGGWVFGWLYNREREDSAILRDQGDRNSKALETLTRLVRAQAAELRKLRDIVKALHDQHNGGG